MLDDPLLEDLLVGSRTELQRFAAALSASRPALHTVVDETSSGPHASSQRLQMRSGDRRVSVDVVVGTQLWWDKTLQWRVTSGIALGGTEDDDPAGPDLTIAIGESYATRARRYSDWLESFAPFLLGWQPEVLAALALDLDD